MEFRPWQSNLVPTKPQSDLVTTKMHLIRHKPKKWFSDNQKTQGLAV